MNTLERVLIVAVAITLGFYLGWCNAPAYSPAHLITATIVVPDTTPPAPPSVIERPVYVPDQTERHRADSLARALLGAQADAASYAARESMMVAMISSWVEVHRFELNGPGVTVFGNAWHRPVPTLREIDSRYDLDSVRVEKPDSVRVEKPEIEWYHAAGAAVLVGAVGYMAGLAKARGEK